MSFWDFGLWSGLVQFGVICLFIIVANILRRYIPFLRNSLLPTALIGGLIAFIFRSIGWLDFISQNFLDGITYHTMAIGFIALALKQQYGRKNDNMKKGMMKDGINAGATIVGTYLIQGIIGLGITILLAATFLPWLFEASGILTAIGLGQGQGQSNSFGRLYEELGFSGGQSFALSIASIGILIGSIISVIYINILKRKGKINIKQIEKASKIVEADTEDEIPLSEPVDRMTMTICVIMFIFMLTFAFLFGFNHIFIESGMFGEFGENTLRPLIFGFNFIVGMLFAFLYKKIFKTLKRRGIIKHQYTSNYSLNRIGGTMFDFMIIAGILLIDIHVLARLILPLILLCLFGTIATFYYLKIVAKRLAKGYEEIHFIGMFAMLTGKISTGIAIIRLIDPGLKTKASDNLVLGSSFAVVFGFPMMFMLALAPTQPLLTLGVLILLFTAINIFLFRERIFRRRRKTVPADEVAEEIEIETPLSTSS
ncbi:MAG: hypothetical protein FWE45_02130 [Firmicutes bacterium]|nr:hypothetical protein [Bacillota bacterium]